MLYLILSIIGSVSVGVLFKILKNYNINIFLIILINYIVTSFLSYYIFDVDLTKIPNNLPFSTILALGFLLPTIFLAQYYSIKNTGIIKTDIAQRLSLLIPILSSIFLFKEQFNTTRYVALTIGLIAIYFILNKASLKEKKSNNFLIPLVSVFIGFGVIDIFFKKLALYSAMPYKSSLFFVFATALLFTSFYCIFFERKEVIKLSKSTLFGGVSVGILNFINIFFYLKAHSAFTENPTIVFAGMNFGVILLGTLIGYLFFNEKLNRMNVIGLLLALIAIVLLMISL